MEINFPGVDIISAPKNLIPATGKYCTKILFDLYSKSFFFPPIPLDFTSCEKSLRRKFKQTFSAFVLDDELFTLEF